jgi:spore maturation protein CgeB
MADFEMKYNFYLADWEASKAIIEAGYEHAINNHTFDIRAKQMANIIEGF